MYHPTTRVLTTLELLQTYGQMSGAELARRLEVNSRTVRHYITLLQDIGIPVEAERGRHGGYRLRPGFKLPPLMFNEDEALALTLGLLTAQRLGLATTAPAVEGALAKVERVMPDALRARMAAVQETLIINASSLYTAPASSDVLTFSVAAQRRQRVAMCYQAWSKEETERVIDPYGVVFYDGRWFVVGYCHLRTAMRTFRLDRVVHVAACEESFEPPDSFDCLAFVVQSLAEAPGAWTVEVVLETTMDVAHDRVPAATAMLQEVTEGVLLRCHAQNLHWMACFLVSLGCPMIVRQPPELCHALQNLRDDITATVERSIAMLNA